MVTGAPYYLPLPFLSCLPDSFANNLSYIVSLFSITIVVEFYGLSSTLLERVQHTPHQLSYFRPFPLVLIPPQGI
jgi:hypothetical protein